MRLSIERTREPRGLRLAGELDLESADELAQELNPLVEEGGDVYLDVSKLEFVDSTGVSVIARAAVAVEGRGSVVVLHPDPMLRRIFAIAGLERLPGLEVRD